VNGVTREYLAGPILYAVATVIAFVSVWTRLAIHALLALLYVVPNQSRP
jgi:ACR3 family arsenite efflux pump ArsB